LRDLRKDDQKNGNRQMKKDLIGLGYLEELRKANDLVKELKAA